ncbi:MAG: tRNA (adenosine(37)-N6)-threonylcarbamoyltransferase complex transferase subunit TsaD [Phycisphaeraceae bacterium]
MTLILGIESSCDETAAAVVENGRLVRSNVIASQHELHRKYHGVVPEIASRAHLERLGPVVDEALKCARVRIDQIDAVAVGNRPGLIGSLIVGVSATQALAWSTGKPLIGIDHVRAHLYAATLDDSSPRPQAPSPKPVDYPAVGLAVSGGHTSLYDVQSPTQLRLLGRTIDDAVGEAYDKAAVILQLGYPGGPALDQLAPRGDPTAYPLPRSLLGASSLDFSFSGLKTALLYTVRGKPKGRGSRTTFERSANDLTDPQRADLAASFQAAAIDTLITKINRAIDMLSRDGQTPKSLVIGGGVSANSLLRQRAIEIGQRHGIAVHLPAMEYCLDNAAMIAGLAFEYYSQEHFDDLSLPAIATTR